jgi:hypothetical protein
MPLVRLLGYYHAALWVNGAWTVRPAKRETASLEALFAALPKDESDD